RNLFYKNVRKSKGKRRKKHRAYAFGYKWLFAAQSLLGLACFAAAAIVRTCALSRERTGTFPQERSDIGKRRQNDQTRDNCLCFHRPISPARSVTKIPEDARSDMLSATRHKPNPSYK